MTSELYVTAGVFIAGIVSFLSPCVLPLVPPYLAYLGGASLEQVHAGQRLERAAARRIILAAMFFVLGFTTVFVALGASASLLGQALLGYKDVLSKAAGAVIILFGLHFLGILKIPFLYVEKRFHTDMEGASLAGSYLIGLAFAFGWTPCVGPILATVLAVASQEQSLYRGIWLLFVYSMGLGVPFLLAAVAIQRFMGFMQRFRRHLGMMEKVMGAMLIVTGLLFVTGSINTLGNWLLTNVPFLMQLEEWFAPKDLQGQILKQR